MVDSTVHVLSVLFAIISGTGAGLLALQYWLEFRQAPFGSIVAILSAMMSAMIIYHVILFLLSPASLFVETFRSSLYTIVAIFLWLVIATHRQIEEAATGGRIRD